MLFNTTNQAKSTVELGYMCPRGLLGPPAVILTTAESLKSDLKWCILVEVFFIFQLLSECHCWLTSESLRAHVAKFYG